MLPMLEAESRSFARAEASSVLVRAQEDWSGHFDGFIHAFHHGLVLGVKDALVGQKLNCQRSIFVYGFAGNRVLRWNRILEICLQRHLDGHGWQHDETVCSDLREIALAELRGGPLHALALLGLATDGASLAEAEVPLPNIEA